MAAAPDPNDNEFSGEVMIKVRKRLRDMLEDPQLEDELKSTFRRLTSYNSYMDWKRMRLQGAIPLGWVESSTSAADINVNLPSTSDTSAVISTDLVSTSAANPNPGSSSTSAAEENVDLPSTTAAVNNTDPPSTFAAEENMDLISTSAAVNNTDLPSNSAADKSTDSPSTSFVDNNTDSPPNSAAEQNVDLPSTSADKKTDSCSNPAANILVQPDLSLEPVLMGTLLPIIECNICLETVRIPFRMCFRGHLHCTACIPTGMANCGVCRGYFLPDAPVCVRQMLEALPRICSHPNCGKVIRGQHGMQHERYCRLRQTCCEECDTRLPICQLKDHHQENHGGNGNQPRVGTAGNVETDFEWVRGIHEFCVFAFEQVFWIEISKNISKNLLELSCSANYVGEPEQRYFVTLTIENESGFISGKLLVSDADVMNPPKATLSIAFDSTKKFLSNNLLRFHYELSREPKFKHVRFTL